MVNVKAGRLVNYNIFMNLTSTDVSNQNIGFDVIVYEN